MSAGAPSSSDIAPDIATRHATAPTWAVVGASNDRAKFGNKIYRALRTDGYTVYAVNLGAPSVEGDPAWPRVADLPAAPEVVNLVIPPGPASSEVVRQAAARGAKAVWFQPGAEDAAAIRLAAELGLDVVRDCILVRRSAPRRQGVDAGVSDIASGAASEADTKVADSAASPPGDVPGGEQGSR